MRSIPMTTKGNRIGSAAKTGQLPEQIAIDDFSTGVDEVLRVEALSRDQTGKFASSLVTQES